MIKFILEAIPLVCFAIGILVTIHGAFNGVYLEFAAGSILLWGSLYVALRQLWSEGHEIQQNG